MGEDFIMSVIFLIHRFNCVSIFDTWALLSQTWQQSKARAAVLCVGAFAPHELPASFCFQLRKQENGLGIDECIQIIWIEVMLQKRIIKCCFHFPKFLMIEKSSLNLSFVARFCLENLLQWIKRQRKCFEFGVLIVCREPKRHFDVCDFCLVNKKVINCNNWQTYT